MKKLLAFLIALLLAQPAFATCIPSIPYNLTNGSLADATQVMGNFNTIVTDVNANCATAGVNSNITSLTGLTTPLAPTFGGAAYFFGSTSTGTANAQVLATMVPSTFSLTDGYMFTMTAGYTNNGALTINPNGLGVTNVNKPGAGALASTTGGELQAGNKYLFTVVGSQLEVMNPNFSTDGINFTFNSAGNLAFGSAPVLPGTTLASSQVQTDNTAAPATDKFVNSVARGEQVFTTTGTFTTPASAVAGTQYEFIVTGGGGAGGGGTQGGGGGAGATCVYYVSALASGQSETITVGGGGAGSSTTGASGTNSSILVNSVTVTAPGGNGAVGGGATTNLGAAQSSACTNATLSLTGGGGMNGSGSYTAGLGGASYWGGGANPLTGTTGNTATAYGAGGSGANNGNGGAGAAGVAVVKWW